VGGDRRGQGKEDKAPAHAVRVWDGALGAEAVRLGGARGGRPRQYGGFLALSDDGKALATSETEQRAGSQRPFTIRLWEMGTGRELLRCHPRWAADRLAFSPDGTRLASTHADQQEGDGRICLWDVATGAELACFGGHSTWITALAFAPDGTRLATASQDETVLIWDVPAPTGAPAP
jgi:WD40 repeat protein